MCKYSVLENWWGCSQIKLYHTFKLMCGLGTRSFTGRNWWNPIRTGHLFGQQPAHFTRRSSPYQSGMPAPTSKLKICYKKFFAWTEQKVQQKKCFKTPALAKAWEKTWVKKQNSRIKLKTQGKSSIFRHLWSQYIMAKCTKKEPEPLRPFMAWD